MPVTIEKEIKNTGRKIQKIYETVAERVQKFRDACPVSEGWALKTQINFPDGNMVLAIAQMVNPNGSIVATGTAEEVRNASYINKTSAVENAETSAIGRCLFAAGFGGGEFCSADELLTALKRQEQLKAEELKVIKYGGTGQSPKTDAPKPASNPPGMRPAPTPPKEKQSVNPSTSKPIPNPPSEKPAEILGPRLKGVTYRREGTLIIAEGNTFPVKGVLDTAGFKWNPGLKAMAKEVVA